MKIRDFAIRNKSKPNTFILHTKGRPGNDNRISYTETHIPLQKGIDDCIDDHNSGGTALTPMLPDHERNPDIIPISRRGKYIYYRNVYAFGGKDSLESTVGPLENFKSNSSFFEHRLN